MSCKIPGFMGFVHPPSHGGIPGVMPGIAGASPMGPMGLPGAVVQGVGMEAPLGVAPVGQGILLGEAGVAVGQEYDFIHIYNLYISVFFLPENNDPCKSQNGLKQNCEIAHFQMYAYFLYLDSF